MSDNDIIIGQFKEFMIHTAQDIEELKEMMRENAKSIQAVSDNFNKWQMEFSKEYSKYKLETEKEMGKIRSKFIKLHTIGVAVWGGIVIALKYFNVI